MPYCNYDGFPFWFIGWGIFLLIFLVFTSRMWWGRSRGYWRSTGPWDAMEALKERYAKGEISKEEFEKIKKDIV